MSRFSLRLNLVGLIAVGILSACIPAATPSGPSAAEVEAMVATSVALTVTAHAQTQAAIPTLTPTASRTETPSPTVTASPFPTFTPFSTPTKFPTILPTQADYACAVFNKSPADNSIFKPNKDFDIKFWLRNVGSRKWDKGADLSYHDGPKMIVGNTVYELREVKPGQMVGPFIFDAKSPRKVGDFVMRLKLQGGFCYPYIKILVRK